MSEYQYYEWQTVDRLLTDTEQEAVHSLSSHIEVSSSRAVVTYAYGSFKHDPRHVLARSSTRTFIWQTGAADD
jgi:hypothetical protein